MNHIDKSRFTSVRVTHRISANTGLHVCCMYMYVWQSHDIVEIILLLTHVSITDTHFTDTRDWHMGGYTHTYKSTVVF